jgi:hypothetical protein
MLTRSEMRFCSKACRTGLCITSKTATTYTDVADFHNCPAQCRAQRNYYRHTPSERRAFGVAVDNSGRLLHK